MNMQVLIVDAKHNTIKETNINDNLETFYEIIGTDCVSIIGRKINGKMTQIICDEEGKLKAHQYISALSEEMNESLVGNLIIKSQDKSIIDNFNKYGVLTYSTRR
jgi:hypothetical protein